MPELARLKLAIMQTQWAITKDAMEGIWSILDNPQGDVERSTFHAADSDVLPRLLDSGNTVVPDGAKYTTISGDTGFLSVDGPLVPKANIMIASSGMVSTEALLGEFKALDGDDTIKQIVFVFDSPGGAVTGITQLTHAIQSCQKSTVAYAQGMCASAAYWIASQCDKIYSSETALIGSIGVIHSSHKSDEESGLIEIVSSQSPKKNLKPDTSGGRKEIQVIVDSLAEVFVGEVAKGRGVSPAAVVSNFGQGGVKVGKAAIDAGMIEETCSFVDLAKLNKSGSIESPIAANNLPAKSGKQEVRVMTYEEILAKYPEIAVKIKADLDAAQKAGYDLSATETKQRVENATPFLASDSTYPASVRELAAKVITGEESSSSLRTVVAAVDAVLEAVKIKAGTGQNDSDGETRGSGEPAPDKNSADIEDEDQYQADLKAFNDAKEGI